MSNQAHTLAKPLGDLSPMDDRMGIWSWRSA